MSKMQFDYWQNIVNSAELAELTIAQIINSSDYKIATNNDKLIQDYQKYIILMVEHIGLKVNPKKLIIFF